MLLFKTFLYMYSDFSEVSQKLHLIKCMQHTKTKHQQKWKNKYKQKQKQKQRGNKNSEPKTMTSNLKRSTGENFKQFHQEQDIIRSR